MGRTQGRSLVQGGALEEKILGVHADRMRSAPGGSHLSVQAMAGCVPARSHVGDFFTSFPLLWMRAISSDVEKPSVRGIGIAIPILRGTL